VSGDVVPIAKSDGLPARLIKPHTREKFYLHGRYCSIFNTGMHRHWPDNRGYLELFAGSGLAVDAETGDEVDGSPLRAASVSEPGFNRLAFVEADEELAAALETRLRARGVGEERALVLPGDANDRDVLSRAIAFMPNPGLVFVFVDPEDINNEWQAVEFLAERDYPRLDFLVNLPMGAIKRELGNKRYDSTVGVVGTDEWIPRVLAGEPPGPVLRETYAAQFERLVFKVAEHIEVRAADQRTPIYDLVFASRSPRALDFWKKIQAIDLHGQRELRLFE
jgi:three-Cys-motif partner protein